MPPQLSEISEPAAINMAARMQRAPIPVPSLPGGVLDTAFVAPADGAAGGAPLVLLHGFDSSSLEMRRLHPLLEEQAEAWAVDLVWGGGARGGRGGTATRPPARACARS